MTGGAGAAAGNVGVPVLQGLGGGSARGILFQSLVWFLARAAETSRSEPPEMCVCLWSFFLALGPDFCTGRKPTVGLLKQADGRLRRLWTATPGASSLAIAAKEEAHAAIYL